MRTGAEFPASTCPLHEAAPAPAVVVSGRGTIRDIQVTIDWLASRLERVVCVSLGWRRLAIGGKKGE